MGGGLLLEGADSRSCHLGNRLLLQITWATEGSTQNLPHIELIGSDKLLYLYVVVCGLLSQIMSYPVIIYLGDCLPAQALHILLALVQTGYMAQATPHYSTILLRIASAIAHWKVLCM